MIKGTRFFSRRLLPLLLAAVMLLGMLPALTLPVLAEEPPASAKIDKHNRYSSYLSRCCWNWTRSITGRRW